MSGQAVSSLNPPELHLTAAETESIARAVPDGMRNIKDIYPLAPLQEGLLFHHAVGGKVDLYVLLTLLEFASRPQLQAFIDALQRVIDRHDILRSAVLWEDISKPVQVVYRRAVLPVEELSIDPDREPLEYFKERMTPELQHLDVTKAPLLRLQVAPARLDARWYALLGIHHLVCDGHSLGTLISEVLAHLAGEAAGLPDPVPYRAHVTQALAQSRTPEGEAFFRRKLGDIDEPTAPYGVFDVGSERTQTPEVRQVLEPSLAARLRGQARINRVTPATLFHAGWGLVLAATTGRDDVVFGTVLLGRLHMSSGVRHGVGMFLNTLPLRLRLGEVTAAELVSRTQKELFELLQHEQASLAMAQHCSGIVGSAPLFTALLNYRQRPRHLEGGWTQESLGIREITSQVWTHYPLTLSVDDFGDRLALTIQTDPRIDPHRIMQYTCACLESLVDTLERVPHAAALSVSVLPISERREVIEGFNSAPMPYPQEKLVHQLFEEQAERTPDEVGVAYEQESLTYRQLNSKANQLARYLMEKGVGPGQLVGLCIERSLEMVIGILGILKAGGAYIPLDPAYPEQRLAYVFADAAPKLLLTQAHLSARLGDHAAETISIDEDWPAIARQEASRLDAHSHFSHQLAYVIYTSGSTGNPKGVMVEHRSVVNFLCSMQRSLGIRAKDSLLAVTTLSFDIAALEIYLPLVSGATVFLASRAAASDPAQLIRMIEELEIDILQATPATWELLLSAGWQGRSTLVALCGGEALPTALAEKLGSRVATLWNLYGPTETTIWSCAWRVTAPLDLSNAVESIGRPIENTQIYVLDQHRGPVPIGVAGEIYIGGAGVARGYLNRPELTAERFTPDPYGKEPQGRIYRTGDLGRWRADGTLEYLGRNDHQVKIRGFRIELGEIEAQLARHAQVKQAVVVAREDIPGEKRLVAYWIAQSASPDNAEPSAEVLRAHLKSTLPEYMIPSAFVLLESFPLTPNGKLDRRALPAPELGAYASRQYEPPQGPVEEILTDIWQSLLKVPRVGRHDNFFELGGHSLLIVQMMERLRRVGLSPDVRAVFESPTLADVASRLLRKGVSEFDTPPNLIPSDATSITPRMLNLVELEPGHIERIVDAVPGGAANIQDVYPLTPLQEGLLFHHLLDDSGEDIYARWVLLTLSSPETLDQFISAMHRMVHRHDALRTAVLWEQTPSAIQVVQRSATLPIERIVLDPKMDSIEQLQERMRSEGQRMDLRQAPLLRLLVAADPHTSQCYALLHTHHLVCDNQSIAIVVDEVTSLIEQRAQTLPEPMPYRNHVARVLARARTYDAEAFFRERLGDLDEPTAPFGLLTLRGGSNRIGKARLPLEVGLSRDVRLRARQLGVSAATLFHAAWALVVARASGRHDVVFGTVLLGQMQGSAGLQRMVGMFINTLPIRLRLHRLDARQLVEKTQHELVELLSHEEVSLAVAQKCSGITGSIPLFSSLLNYRHAASGSGEEWSADAGVRVVASRGGTHYPVMLSVDDLGEGFALETEADDTISPDRVNAYVATAVRSLLEALDGAPPTPALALSVLPEDERHRVLQSFNATEAAYPAERQVQELFEEQVQRAPNAVAVVYEGRSLTYAELEDKANRLARYLRRHLPGPDLPVALCVERGLEMVVGLLGILKAGAAYVPLDPNYPIERLRYILADAAPGIGLTQDHLAAGLPQNGTRWVALDGDWPAIARQEASRLDSHSHFSHHLAYVIYTSGSTGNPKGVMVEHRSVVNFLCSMQRSLDIRAKDSLLAVTTPSFDIAALEIYLPLVSGATVFLASRAAVSDPAQLIRMIEELEIDILQATPATWELLLSAGWPGRSTLVALCGGEALPTALAEKLASRVATLWNLYGPTETTIWSCARRVTTPLDLRNAVESIGRPIENTQIYVLDQHRGLVPIGVAGEIYIGGAGVARGYLNRPELTAERFTPDPYGKEPQGRIYRTGDLGRWRADGTLEYLGRNDHQVKIRGFRIELGEIEAQLARHAQVKQAVVVAREDIPGEKRLVAYWIAQSASPDNAEPSAEVLRAHLKSTLPEYMIPSAFVLLESFPLTPNGKLDRRALPAPELGAYASRQYEPPQGPVEEILTDIWQSLLKVPRVGRHDNFFELGGHSLLGMKMIMRVAERLRLHIPVSALFQHATVQRMAALIGTQLSGDVLQGSPSLSWFQPPLAPRQQADPIPLTYSQQFWWHTHGLDKAPGRRSIASSARLSGPLRIDCLQGAFREILARHESLRTRIVIENGILRQHIDAAAKYSLDSVDLTALSLEDAELEAKRRVRDLVLEPVSLAEGPLFVAKVFKLGQCEHVLVISMEHIVSDAASLSIVWSELLALYRHGSRESSASLPKINMQLADYAVWQQKAHPSWSERHGDFWREHLAGARRVQLSECGGTAAPNSGFPDWAEAPVQFDAHLSAALRESSRKRQTTLTMSVLTAFAAVVLRWASTSDLVTPFITSGRFHPEFHDSVGFFSARVFLRLSLGKDATLLDLLERVTSEYSAVSEHYDGGWIAAQTPTPEFCWNPTFNWIPDEFNIDPEQDGPGAQEGPQEMRCRLETTLSDYPDERPDGELHLSLSDTKSGVMGAIYYRADLFTPDTVHRFGRDLYHFAERLVNEPTARVARLLLAERERDTSCQCGPGRC